MPSPVRLVTRRAMPWTLVWEVGKSVWDKGRDHVNENLSAKERTEFSNLLKKSKGRRNRLTPRERTRFSSMVRKAATGDPKAGWARVARAVALLLPPQIVSSIVQRRRKT